MPFVNSFPLGRMLHPARPSPLLTCDSSAAKQDTYEQTHANCLSPRFNRVAYAPRTLSPAISLYRCVLVSTYTLVYSTF